MTDVVVRKMLRDALKSHSHADLIADVIVDGMKFDDYGKSDSVEIKPSGKILIDAFAGIDHRLMIPVGTTVIVHLSSWYASKWDLPAMREAGLCVADEWYLAVITEVRSYVTAYPYKVDVHIIDKDGYSKQEPNTISLKDIKRWVK